MKCNQEENAQERKICSKNTSNNRPENYDRNKVLQEEDERIIIYEMPMLDLEIKKSK